MAKLKMSKIEIIAPMSDAQGIVDLVQRAGVVAGHRAVADHEVGRRGIGGRSIRGGGNIDHLLLLGRRQWCGCYNQNLRCGISSGCLTGGQDHHTGQKGK